LDFDARKIYEAASSSIAPLQLQYRFPVDCTRRETGASEI
jgi:hypothetical protein